MICADPPKRIKKELLQNTSGGTLSGDFPPKTKMFSAENTPKIHRSQYFAAALFVVALLNIGF